MDSRKFKSLTIDKGSFTYMDEKRYKKIIMLLLEIAEKHMNSSLDIYKQEAKNQLDNRFE